jgi:hypothetical protein
LRERNARDRSVGDGGAGTADVTATADVTTASHITAASDVTAHSDYPPATGFVNYAGVCGAFVAYRAADTGNAEYPSRRGAW